MNDSNDSQQHEVWQSSISGGDAGGFQIQQSLDVEIPAGEATLRGYLCVPQSLRGAVLFAHGSGSSRNSPRNQLVAKKLQKAHFATLLFDLLTEGEERADEITAHLRFNIDLLASRLVRATRWLSQQRGFDQIRLGYFGASTGAAAALRAAAKVKAISAVVSRGGRPDLASESLDEVQCAVLLIVGAEDRQVIELNREALARLKSEKRMAIIPHASHLFEEPGTLEQVAELACQWFERWLGPKSAGINRAA